MNSRQRRVSISRSAFRLVGCFAWFKGLSFMNILGFGVWSSTGFASLDFWRSFRKKFRVSG